MASLREQISRHYVSRLLAKCYRPELFDVIIGTALVYSKWLKLLSKARFTKIVEVGPGPFSVVALAIKASFLTKAMRYYAVENDLEAADELAAFFASIGLKYKLILDTFRAPHDICCGDNSIICFEHSLDDLLIKEFSLTADAPTNTWQGVIAEQVKMGVEEQAMVSYIGDLLTSLIMWSEQSQSCFIIHHHYCADYRGDVVRESLDSLVISALTRAYQAHRDKLVILNQSPNWVGELFLCGGLNVFQEVPVLRRKHKRICGSVSQVP